MKDKLILLVEDNPDDEALALRALQKHAFAKQIVVVRDGAEALEYLFGTGSYVHRDQTINPHLILLDLNLPKIDGFEVLRQVRNDERTCYTPVVILTTSDEESDRMQSYRLCANSYVRKPVDFNQFAEAIGQIGLYWLLLNETASFRNTMHP